MKIMKNYYRRYAFSDVVEAGQVKVIQEWRDSEFEQWMKQAGIEIMQHLSTRSRMPKAKKKKFGYRPFYSFFHFHHQLSVFSNQKSLTLDRTRDLNIEGSLSGQLNVSDADDFISSTCFKITLEEKPISERPIRPDGGYPHSESQSHNPENTRKTRKSKSHQQLGQTTKPQNQEAPQRRPKVTLNPGGTIVPPEADEPQKPIQPSQTTPIQTRKLQGMEVDESF